VTTFSKCVFSLWQTYTDPYHLLWKRQFSFKKFLRQHCCGPGSHSRATLAPSPSLPHSSLSWRWAPPTHARRWLSSTRRGCSLGTAPGPPGCTQCSGTGRGPRPPPLHPSQAAVRCDLQFPWPLHSTHFRFWAEVIKPRPEACAVVPAGTGSPSARHGPEADLGRDYYSRRAMPPCAPPTCSARAARGRTCAVREDGTCGLRLRLPGRHGCLGAAAAAAAAAERAGLRAGHRALLAAVAAQAGAAAPAVAGGPGGRWLPAVG
jgi:hypothetical protein